MLGPRGRRRRRQVRGCALVTATGDSLIAVERLAGPGVPAPRPQDREGGPRLLPGFVARDRELAALTTALDRPSAVVFIEGETGIGKTRLLHEFTASAADRHRILAVDCLAFRQPHTLGPLVDAVRHATDGIARFRLSALAGALRPLFPEWTADLPPAPEPAEDATAARHRVFRALCELLTCLGVNVLIVDDAHWADEATLEFLLFAQPQFSLVVSYRPEEIPADSLLLRLSTRTPPRLRLTLAPLDAAATARVVSTMIDGEPVSAEFADFIHRCTEGLPLAVEELVRLLYDRADLIVGDRGWQRRPIVNITVPPTVRDAVLERAARLTPDTQAMLSAAAVLAEPATEAVLTEVSGLAPDRARTALASALGAGLLTETAPDLATFRHMLAARAIDQAIPAPQRRALHLRAARALERQSPRPTGQLARHCREAGDTAKWCRYGEQEADLALASGDEKTAAWLLHDLVTGASLAAADVARLTRKLPFHALRGQARLRELIDTFKTILARPTLDRAEEASLRFQVGLALMIMQEWAEGRAELEQAIPHLEQDPVMRSRAMMLLAWPKGTTCPAGVHLRWLRRAARVPGPMDPAERHRFAIERVTALLALGAQEGWREAGELPREAATAREARLIAGGHINIGDLALRWGRYGEARWRLDQALNLAAKHDYRGLYDMALTSRAHLDWCTGSWAGLADQTAYLAADDNLYLMSRMEAALVAGLLEAAAGAAQQAGERLHMVLQEAEQRMEIECVGEPAAALARLYLAEGRTADALEVTSEPIAIAQRKQIWVWATDVAPARVAALVAAGRTGDADQLVTAFARGVQGLKAPAPKAGLALCRAVLTENTGDQATAAAQYARAAAAWQALPRPYDALLARERQAHCLLAAGQADAALPLLTQVFHGLTGLGAGPHADRVAQQLREHGLEMRPLTRRGRRGYGDQLSPRELDVVRLVVNGKTNKEIARLLARSPTTVAGQLSSAMRKLQVTSRTTLAVRAIEAGIPAGTPGSN
jgi:DNA-binding CsgD family transcriptional regulator